MPTSLVIAIGVTAGVAAGVFVDPSQFGPARWCAALFGVGWFLLAARGLYRFSIFSFAGAIAAVSVLAGADAQQRALHPPLRQVLEDQFGGFAIETIGAERIDTPI